MSPERPDQPSSTRHDQWTIELDLTRSGEVNVQLAALRELAPKTEKKPVTIIVQVLDSIKSASSKTAHDAEGKPSQDLVRQFLVQDGKMQQTSSRAAGTFEQGLEDLIAAGKRLSDGKKLALFIAPEHGEGGAGIWTYSGQPSLTEFDSTIKGALERNNIEKIDVLDMYACEMAQTSALDHFSAYTDHLVAASTLTQPNSQSVNDWLGPVLANPSLGSAQLADAVVDSIKEANRPITDGEPHTLAHFNLVDNYRPFAKALDNFASALTAASSDQVVGPSLQNSFDTLKHVTTEGLPAVSLNSLLNTVLSNEKILADTFHGLRDAAQTLKEQEEKLVGSHFAISPPNSVIHQDEERAPDFLSIFMPLKKDFFDIRTERLEHLLGDLLPSPALSISEQQDHLKSLAPKLKTIRWEARSDDVLLRELQPLSFTESSDFDTTKFTDSQVKDVVKLEFDIVSKIQDQSRFRNFWHLDFEHDFIRQQEGEIKDSNWSHFTQQLITTNLPPEPTMNAR